MLRRSVTLLMCVALVAGVHVGADARKKLPLQAVTCDFEVTRSIRLANSIWDCPVHGLIVKTTNITIDLNGKTVDGDSDHSGTSDAGISNDEGYDRVTVKNGTISGFNYGVHADPLPAEYSTIKDVTIRDSQWSGVYLPAKGARLLSSTVIGSVFNGVVMVGESVVVEGNVVKDSDDDCIGAGGTNARIANNKVEGCRSGFSVGRGATVVGNRSLNNERFGFYVSDGAGTRLDRNFSSGNLENGYEIGAMTSDLVFTRNTASRNAGFGFHNTAATSGLRFMANKADTNGLNGFEISADNVSYNRDRATRNGRSGFLTDGDDLHMSRVVAIGNAWEGIWVRSGVAPTVTRSTGNSNGFFNGAADQLGFGIRIDVADPVASRNKAKGNDNPAQCTANAACN